MNKILLLNNAYIYYEISFLSHASECVVFSYIVLTMISS
jgi:hypothetical protein